MSAAAFPDQPLGDQSPCTILGNSPITPPVETALVIGKFPRRWGWLGKLLKTPFFRHVVRQIGSKAMRLFTDLQTNHPET